MANGEKPRYDGRCRDSHEHHAADEPCVVRFRNPQDGSVIFDDQIRGWLFARHYEGEFVLRIEDTDLERSTPEAIEAIMDGMNWLSLDWDEGPYYQTKRFDRYNDVIDEMLEARR
ncbi:hypothetical protein CRX72_24250 [Pantoea sp. BRM17]|nr:hypothetical protein CRX72_24250 [Pantoea sp. BRM17]